MEAESESLIAFHPDIYLPAAGAAAGAAAGSAAAGAATVGAAAASWGTGEARAAWRQNRLRIQNFMLPGLRRY